MFRSLAAVFCGLAIGEPPPRQPTGNPTSSSSSATTWAMPTSACTAARTFPRRTSTRWRRTASAAPAAMSPGRIAVPTRAGLLTGRYQQRFGHEFNPGRRSPADVWPAADRDHARRPAEGGRLRDRHGRQVAPGRTTEKFHPLQPRLRRVLRLPRRGSSVFPGKNGSLKQGILRGARGGRREGIPDRRLRPRGGGLHRPPRRRSRSSSI